MSGAAACAGTTPAKARPTSRRGRRLIAATALVGRWRHAARSRPRRSRASSVTSSSSSSLKSSPSSLLGKVEVAVGHAAQHDWDAEEAAHRRVVFGEAPGRAGVLGQVVQAPAASRPRISAPRMPRPRGRSPIPRRARRASIPVVTKRSRSDPAPVDHAERGVTRRRSARRPSRRGAAGARRARAQS